MNHLMKKIIIIICFVLLVPTITPLAASPSIEFDHRNNTYSIKSAVTSTKDLLVTEVMYNPNEVLDYAYHVDISLVTENGIKKQISTNTYRNIFTYKEKVYVITYDPYTTQFMLYDEQLNLLEKQELSSNGVYNNYIIEQYDEYIVFYYPFDLTGKALTGKPKFYNLYTQAFEEPPATPISSAYVDLDNGITLTDNFTREKKFIPYSNFSFDGKPLYALVYQDKIVFFSEESVSYKVIYNIYTLDFDGNVLDTKALEADRYSYNSNLDSFIHNGILKLSIGFSTKFHSQLYEYHLNTFKLTGPEYHNQTIYRWNIVDGIYKEVRGTSNQSEIFFKNQHEELLFKYKKDGYTLEEMPPQEQINAGISYIVLNHEDPVTRKNTPSLYDFSTGQELGSFTEYDKLQILNNPNYILAFDGNKATLLNLTGDKPTEPIDPTYEHNKMWTVTTSMNIDAAKLNSNNVYVLDEQGQKVAITYNVVGNQIFVYAPNNGYQSQKNYTLFVEGLISVTGDHLKDPKSKNFTIK